MRLANKYHGFQKDEFNSSTYQLKLFIIMLTCLVYAGGFGLQSANSQDLVPPPPPDVPPLISETYSNDEDGNRIEDQLKLGVGPPRQTTPLPLKPPIIETVDVQLTFASQITQQQIDDFLGIGGEITYIYKAISHGWRGRIPEPNITLLPDLMGPTMVIVEEPPTMVRNMDIATKTGRVRPIWDMGFYGDESITIGIIDSGIDASHPDLAGRQAYWRDFSREGYLNPIDTIQHGTHVAGIALGTGRSNYESLRRRLNYTEIGNLQDVPEGNFLVSPINLSSQTYTFESKAEWRGGGRTKLYHVSCPKGNVTEPCTVLSSTQRDWSMLELSSTIDGRSSSDDTLYATALLSTSGSVIDFVITNSVEAGWKLYEINLSGIAPGCRWAAAKDGPAKNDSLTTDNALDDLAYNNRINLNIKIVNISSEIAKTYNGGELETYRQKVNSAVNRGVLVVVAGGNNGNKSYWHDREISDPGRAAMALTVGACNDENHLTDYSSQGFSPQHLHGLGKQDDYKPDIIAPGGSYYLTGIMSVDSGSNDGPAFNDKQPNDYRNAIGTSMASPFVAGCAALVIDAMQQKGIQWDFYSSDHPRYVKMVLCATATETNANRENGKLNPTLQRAANGPNGFPPGKDKYEGYGIINPDAAVEAVYLTHEWGTEENGTLGSGPYDRRAWARTVQLSNGFTYEINLDSSSTSPPQGTIFEPEPAIPEDFDLYLYSAEPSPTGTPVILAASTTERVLPSQPSLPRRGIPIPPGPVITIEESITYIAEEDTNALLVVKRVSGSGDFTLKSSKTSQDRPGRRDKEVITY